MRYSPDNVYFQSDRTGRNLMSASCNAYGMFPAHGDQIWNSATNWQPIPIHSLSANKMYLMLPLHKCPKKLVYFERYIASNKIQSKLNNTKNLRKFLLNYLGIKHEYFMDFYDTFDTLNCEALRGFQ